MRIGMIGGIGPESTVDCYRRFIRLYQDHVDDDGYPEILIDSIGMTTMLRFVSDRDWDGLTGMLSDAVRLLHAAGADLAFMASNTPHIVFEQLRRVAPIPLMSIVRICQCKTLPEDSPFYLLFHAKTHPRLLAKSTALRSPRR